MIVSTSNAELKRYFPFNCCGDDLYIKANRIGKCIEYSSGETVLMRGSPAKHCGIIIEGEAVAFKTDPNGKRYQLCLKEGCFIGLEALHKEQSCTGKIVAISDIKVFFWNQEGLLQLIEDCPDFAESLSLLDEGRIYQEQWLIPDTDITDPVLCSQTSHWVSLIFPSAVILILLSFGLWICSMLIRRYPIAWFLIPCLFFIAGKRIYKLFLSHSSERFIVTAKNMVFIPKSAEAENVTMRLYSLESVSVEQNIIERLLNIGFLHVFAEEQNTKSPLLLHPDKTALLIQSFAQRNALGRAIPVHFSYKQNLQDTTESKLSKSEYSDTGNHTEEKYHFEFRAHWALLVKMVIKPFLLILIAAAGMIFLKDNPYEGSFHKLLIFLLIAGLAGIIYQWASWRNHRFYIEEDCIRDFRRRPFSAEDQNMAMNHKIQSVRYQKDGFFQVLLNYGTVYILAGEGELSFDYVSDPQHVQQLIIEACSQYENKRIQDARIRWSSLSEL